MALAGRVLPEPWLRGLVRFGGVLLVLVVVALITLWLPMLVGGHAHHGN